jgi:hypothetical protein
MPPRGQRLACMIKSMDGCQGTFDVIPGTAEKSIAEIGPVTWDKPPEKPGIQEAMFTIIGDMGMTGQLIRLNSYQWAAITEAKIEKFFYASILWSGNWFKVVEDAQMMTKKK